MTRLPLVANFASQMSHAKGFVWRQRCAVKCSDVGNSAAQISQANSDPTTMMSSSSSLESIFLYNKVSV